MMRTGTPSSGDNLLGMSIDVDAYVSMPDAIDPYSVEVERTDRPECLIRAGPGRAGCIAPPSGSSR